MVSLPLDGLADDQALVFCPQRRVRETGPPPFPRSERAFGIPCAVFVLFGSPLCGLGAGSRPPVPLSGRRNPLPPFQRGVYAPRLPADCVSVSFKRPGRPAVSSFCHYSFFISRWADPPHSLAPSPRDEGGRALRSFWPPLYLVPLVLLFPLFAHEHRILLSSSIRP